MREGRFHICKVAAHLIFSVYLMRELSSAARGHPRQGPGRIRRWLWLQGRQVLGTENEADLGSKVQLGPRVRELSLRLRLGPATSALRAVVVLGLCSLGRAGQAGTPPPAEPSTGETPAAGGELCLSRGLVAQIIFSGLVLVGSLLAT